MNRREQIVATAATLFAERGFHGVSVGDIGAAVGISGPGLYKHFPAKDDLLAYSMELVNARATERVRSHIGLREPRALAGSVELRSDVGGAGREHARASSHRQLHLSGRQRARSLDHRRQAFRLEGARHLLCPILGLA